MAREVVWAESAHRDLEAIAEYIARDSEHYAAVVVREMIEAGRSLGEHAHRGQVVPEFQDQDLRELLVRPYRLIYRIDGGVVLVLAVIHGAQRWRR